MKILNSILFLFAVHLFSVSANAAQVIDLEGIYQSTKGDNNFLTINRKNGQYVLVNISKDLDLLYKLGLITGQEIYQSPVNPPVEEFAFLFEIEESELAFPQGFHLKWGFIPDIIIPFPNRTTSITALPYPLVSITTSTAIANGDDVEIITTTRDVAPYCLISVDVNTSSGEIIVGFEKFTSPEHTEAGQAFTPIDQFYKKIF